MLKSPDRRPGSLRDGVWGCPEFFIACIKRNGSYHVYGKYVYSDGRLRVVSKSEAFQTELEAKERCRSLAKTKIRKKGFVEISLCDVPVKIAPFLEVPPGTQITMEELIKMVHENRRERYVIFKDVNGLEGYFDVGVEYLAKTTDEEGVLLVYDRFGNTKQCFAERMESIVPTEDAKLAEGLKKL